MIVNDIPEADYDENGTTENPVELAETGGRVSAVETGTIASGNFDEAAQHGLGHNLGLGHDSSGLMNDRVNGKTNLNNKERGKIVSGQVQPRQGEGTTKQSDKGGRSYNIPIKKLANTFKSLYDIKD